MQSTRAPAAPENSTINHNIMKEMDIIAQYIRAKYSTSTLTWENGFRSHNQLVSELMDSDTTDQHLLIIKHSEPANLSTALKKVNSRNDQTKYRIVLEFNKLDLESAIRCIKQKLLVIADYLNDIHCPCRNTLWKINDSVQLCYESGSLTYTDTFDASDIERASAICFLLYSGLSPRAERQGLTLNYIETLGKSLIKLNTRTKCIYTLNHDTFVWQDLFPKAADYVDNIKYASQVSVVTREAAHTIFPNLPKEFCQHIGLFMNRSSAKALASTNKAAANALETPEAKQVYGKRQIN